ncbi:MAG: tetratricopeptide repeat protein, partial [Myxococcales bacterium]|nr:tetratricopeptide repeat protein [Myxococcales bacterium]
AELLRARTLLVVGEYVDGLAVAEAAAARADALGWAPLEALADFTVGLLLSRNGRFDDAELRLRQAVRRSLVGADERIAVEAIYYLGMVTRDLHAPERGLVWVEVGRALVERIEGAGGNMTAMMREAEAVLLLERDEVSRAEESAGEAVTIREAHYGADDLGMAPSLELLATIRERRGDLAGAKPIRERVQAIFERAHGPNHPKVAHGLHNLGLAYLRVDDAARARPLLERALAISEQTYGRDSAQLVRLLNTLGTTLSQLDDHDAAIATGERSLAISEAAFGPEHPQVAAALNNLAIAYQGAEKLDKAAELHRRALAIRVAHYGDKGDEVARSHTNLGEIAIKQGRIAEAIEHLEHAVALREAIEVSPLSLAYSRFALARAIVALDPGRAQELAKLAEDAYAAAEHPRAAEIAEWRADAAKAKGTDAKKRKRTKKRKRKSKSKKK